jgi:hypothetical protein
MTSTGEVAEPSRSGIHARLQPYLEKRKQAYLEAIKEPVDYSEPLIGTRATFDLVVISILLAIIAVLLHSEYGINVIAVFFNFLKDILDPEL